MKQSSRVVMWVVLAVVLLVGGVAAAGIVVLETMADDGFDASQPSPSYGNTPLETRSDPVPAPTSTTEGSPPPPSTEPPITKADVLERNDLYGADALRGAGCAAESQVPLDSVANVRAYYASVLPCLNRTWKQVSGEVRFRPAALVVHNGEPVSGCGAFTYSFYCPAEETIYMYADEMIGPWLEFNTDYGHNLSYLAAAHTIAHEYGHHVQQLADIFTVLEPNFFGTETERRLELQASCLGNVFLGSQRDAYPISSSDFADQDLWRFITRVPNHGSVPNQDLWSDRGYGSAEPGSCNAWTAPEPEVR